MPNLLTYLKTLFLVCAMLTVPLDCNGKTDREAWSSVEGIEPGRRIRIRLYDDQAPRGMRKINGHFVSADANLVTIISTDGATETFKSQTVRRVTVRRPLLKRPTVWIVTGIVAGVTQATVVRYLSDDWTWHRATIFAAMFIYFPIWATSTAFMSHQVIYDASSSGSQH